MGNVNEGARPPSIDPIAIAQRFQDRLIRERLPDWMGKVQVEDYPLLREALVQGLHSRRQLAKLWDRVESLDSFCAARLNAALKTRFDVNLDAEKHFLRQWYVYASPEHSYYTSRLATPATDYFDVSLLSAAMSNFSKAQAAEGGQHVRNTLVDEPGATVTTLSAYAFAQLCRELDLGGQYQRHLEAVLESDASGQGEPDCKALLLAHYRSTLLVDAFKARAEGVLKEAELELMINLYTHGTLGHLEKAPVIAKQLKAFDCHLQHIVVFDVVDKGLVKNSSKRVLVYIPGDPQGPWCAANDLESFARKILGKRLRDEDYRQFFERFVLQRDRPAFFASVEQRLGDVADWATRDLKQHMHDYPTALFEHLSAMRIRQIKEDAAVFATPVTLIDRDAVLAKNERRHAQGMALLTLAGLFVPVIGAALLAVMAWELLSEVFQSVKDWREGDTDAALDHLMNVGKDMALLGATTAGIVAARTLWERSVVVDALVPAVLENGSEKLWNQDLAPYVSAPPPAQATVDESGVYREGEQSWIQMEGLFYPAYQEESSGDWYLQPYENHAPLLEHNDAGAWRLWSERPAEWRGSERMFRRLGATYNSLEDRQIRQVLLAHDMNEDHLRAVHVFANVPEAELADTVNRFLLANRIVALRDRLQLGLPVVDQALLDELLELTDTTEREGQALAEVVWAQRRKLFQSLYDKINVTQDASVQTLRRDFSRLHRLAAEQLWNEASDGDRQVLAETGRVPLTMAQAARQRVLRIRVAQVVEGLFIDTPQTLDLARGVTKLIDTLPGAPMGRHWVLFEGDSLLSPGHSAPGRDTFWLSHQEGIFILRGERGEALGQPGELFEVLSDAFTEAQRNAMAIGEPFAQGLREVLRRHVAARRKDLAELLGREQPTPSFLVPLRLDDGRIGYPLSGGLRRFPFDSSDALKTKLRYLYPSFSDTDVEDWIKAVGERHEDPQEVLDDLEAQYELLRNTLTRWQRAGVRHFERSSRYHMRKELIYSWRMLIPEQVRPPEQQTFFRFSLRGLDVSQLPELPEPISFPHVTAIDLHSMKLRDLPDGFLRAFPNLVTIEITHCKLQRFPLFRGLHAQLRIIDLSDNKIRLDAEQIYLLNGCRSLVYLNLSRNPLHLEFSVTGMPRLATLVVRNAHLHYMPAGVELHQMLYELDMLGNNLRAVPEGFTDSVLWRRGRVRFESQDLGLSVEEARAWYRPDDGQVPPRLLWLDRVDPDDRDDMAQFWHLMVSEPNSSDFIDLLGRLVQSEDFAHDSTARDLAYRVFDMLEAMAKDETLCSQLLAAAEIRTCGDNALLRFSDLEIWMLAWEAEQGEYRIDPEPGLLHLGAQLWRQSALDDFARRFAIDMPGEVDEVEVVLAFRVRLFDDLDLPGNRSRLRFTGAVGDIDGGVENARNTILGSQTEDTLLLWMVEQHFWTKYLERAYGSKLKLPRRFRDREQALSSQEGSEQALQALQEEVDQWRFDQRMALTTAAMRRVTPGWRLPVL